MIHTATNLWASGEPGESSKLPLSALVGLGMMAVLPLLWVNLGRVLGLNLKLVHIGILVLTLLILIAPGYRRRIVDFTISSRLFVTAACCYLGLLVCSLGWSDAGSESFAQLLKMSIYLYAFILLGGAFLGLRSSRAKAMLFWGGAAAVAFFIGFASWTYSQFGRSLPNEFFDALLEGNIAKLQFGIYLDLFNYTSAGFSERGSANWTGASLRNTLIGGFVLAYISMQIGRVEAYRLSPAVARLVFWGMSVVVILLIYGSLSRSNIVVFSIVLIVGHLPGMLHARLSMTRAVKFGGVLLLMSLGLLITSEIHIFGALAERLVAIGADPRLGMFDQAMTLIESKWILGYGVGAVLPGVYENSVHNLFLAAWYQAGVIGMLVSVAFYGIVLSVWLRAMITLVVDHDQERREFPWICTLPILPLVRSLVSGDNGNFTLAEWSSLALFYSMYLAYRNESRSALGTA